MCPVIGDGVTICAGAGVFGDIQIADDVMIASNAVVVKNIETCGAVVGGVPAKIIGMNSLLSLTKIAMALDMADELRDIFTSVPYRDIQEVINET